MDWAAALLVALLAVLTYAAAQAAKTAALAAERMVQMAGELDALNTEVARTATLVGQIVAAQQNSVPAAAVQAAADSLKATNDTLQAAIPTP